MADNIMNIFISIIVVQLFFGSSVTLIAYAIPDNALNWVGNIQEGDTFNPTQTAEMMQNAVERQTNIPLVDIGALVFYTGNIILDLVLNFAFAIPTMITMLINLISMLFGGLDTFFITVIQSFFSVLMLSFYFIYILEFVASIRSGGGGIR